MMNDSETARSHYLSEENGQIFDAINLLLIGFEAAAVRGKSSALDDALEVDPDHLYGGLLTILVRLVFLLFAESRGLLPTDQAFYKENLSVVGLFEQLQEDAKAFPESMEQRFGAWPRLVTLFRGIYSGMKHADFATPPRYGSLFNPESYPFIEGRTSAVAGPHNLSIDDETVYGLLKRLLMFKGHRVSYSDMDIEQIGSTYERLIGYQVIKFNETGICIGKNKVWVTAGEVQAIKKSLRKKWFKGEAGMSVAKAGKLTNAISKAPDDAAILTALAVEQAHQTEQVPPGKLVIQPGSERRHTGSHYTPRSLTSQVASRAIDPLLAVMGDSPSSGQILNLQICDPAMGSGAFLLETCRLLAGHLVEAWDREGALSKIRLKSLDPLSHALCLVAQHCLYGVDRNCFAVDLAKLSLWLVARAQNEPFTFVDHALRHGDSLVGLSLKQIQNFHWAPRKKKKGGQSNFGYAASLINVSEDTPERARLVGDLIVGAFFAHEKKKDREIELIRRRDLVELWLASEAPPSEDLLKMKRDIQDQYPVFHWTVEFPEVFTEHKASLATCFDSFIGNPPFAGKNLITASNGEHYIKWLQEIHLGSHGNADLCAHFYRRADALLGNHGTIGFIATNTIAQGDTRDTGLKSLLATGSTIYDARDSFPWPGEAAVTVSTVHLAKGSLLCGPLGKFLGRQSCKFINSRLRPKRERPDPVHLKKTMA